MPTLDHQDIRRIRDLVEVSKAYAKEKFEKARRPAIMRRWFSGDHYGRDMPIRWISKRDRIVVNLSQANAISKVSRLAHKNPVIQVEALDQQSRKLADNEQHYLQYKWRQIEGLVAARDALFDGKIVGTGGLATGWSAKKAEEGSATQAVPEDAPQFKVDRPVVRCVRPDNLILDPDSPDKIQKGWWCGEILVIPLSRMKRMDRYAHVADKLYGASEVTDSWWSAASGEGQGDDDHLRGVTIQVVYLAESGQRVEFCEELKDEPLHVGDQPGVDYPTDDEGNPYFPYVLLRNIPDQNGQRGASTHFGISDIEVTETQQIELDTTRSLMAQHRRMGAPQFFVREGVLDAKAKALLLEGKYNAVIELTAAANEDLTKILIPVPKAPITPEVYTTKEDARRDMSELTRTASFERSGTTPDVDFATEAAMMQAGAESGKAWERQDWENFVADALEQVSYLLHRWGSTEDLVPVAGEEESQPMRGIQLKGRYEHTIEPESMEPPNAAEEEQKWFNRLQGLGQFAEGGADPKPLLRQWLESCDAPDIPEIMEGFDNLAQMKQALEQAGAKEQQVTQMLQQAQQYIEQQQQALQKAEGEIESLEGAVEKAQMQLAIEKVTNAVEQKAEREAAGAGAQGAGQ